MSLFTPQGAPAPTAPTAPTAPPAQEQGEGAGQRQKLLMVAGGVLALALVAFVAYHFLFSGGGGSASAAVPVHNPSVSAAGKPSAPAAAAPVTPLKTHTGTARNPFAALVQQTDSSSASTGSGSTTTGTTGTTTGTSGTTGTTTGTTATTSSVPLVLTLTKVSGTSGVTVNVVKQGAKASTAKTYTPSIGDTFGTYFRLTGFVTDSKGDKGALIEYGDTILTLVAGDKVTVQ